MSKNKLFPYTMSDDIGVPQVDIIGPDLPVQVQINDEDHKLYVHVGDVTVLRIGHMKEPVHVENAGDISFTLPNGTLSYIRYLKKELTKAVEKANYARAALLQVEIESRETVICAFEEAARSSSKNLSPAGKELAKEIMDAYVFLRQNNMSISDYALDFIKEASLKALKSEEVYTSNDSDKN